VKRSDCYGKFALTSVHERSSDEQVHLMAFVERPQDQPWSIGDSLWITAFLPTRRLIFYEKFTFKVNSLQWSTATDQDCDNF